MVWKIGNEMGMSELWAEPEGFDKDAKYFNPLRERNAEVSSARGYQL